MINSKVKQLIAISLVMSLTACSTYKTSFNCGEAQGAYCRSMDHVDQMINSGEIERFNEQRKMQKYKSLKSDDILPVKLKEKQVNITNYQVKDVSN